MSAITVRPAERTDVPWLLRQLQRFAQFFGSKRSLFPDEDTAESIIVDAIEKHPFFVAENGQRVGFISGYLHPHPYNPRIVVLTETFWWVDEAHRGSRAGLKLLDTFLWFGEETADWIVFTLETKSPVNVRSIEKRGFKLFEQSYLKEIA